MGRCIVATELSLACSELKSQKAPSPRDSILPICEYAVLSSDTFSKLFNSKVSADLLPREKRFAASRRVHRTTVHRQQKLVHRTNGIQRPHCCNAALQQHVAIGWPVRFCHHTRCLTDCAWQTRSICSLGNRQRASKHDRAGRIGQSAAAQLDDARSKPAANLPAIAVPSLLTQAKRRCTVRENMYFCIRIGEEWMAEVQRRVSSKHNSVRRSIHPSSHSLAPPLLQGLHASSERLVPQEGLRANVCASGDDGPGPRASRRQHKRIMRASRRGIRTGVDHYLVPASR